MNEQERIKKFIEDHKLETRPEWRAHDLVANTGMLVKELLNNGNYGKSEVKENKSIFEEKIGCVLFSLLALAKDLTMLEMV